MFKKILFIVALMAFVSSASATYYYDNATTDNLWVTANNWYSVVGTDNVYGTLPGSLDKAYPRPSPTYGVENQLIIRAGDTGYANYMKAAFSGSDDKTTQGTLGMYIYGSLILGGTVAGDGGFGLGYNADTYMLVDGGLADGSGIGARNGALVIDVTGGGVLDASNSAGSGNLQLVNSFGYQGFLDLLNVENGEFYCDGLAEGDLSLYTFMGCDIVIGADGVMYVTDVDGSQRDKALTWYNTDGILYAGVAGEGLSITWDGVGLTTIQIPEPATIALLGLGGLLLRKKR